MASSTPWNWKYVCPTGLKPWIEKSNQLAPCFQQIFFEIPTLTIFALLSAYYFGSLNGEFFRRRRIQRNMSQRILLYLRIFATCILGIYPFFKYWFMVEHKMHIWPIDILKGGIEIITFLVHFGWLLGYRRYGSLDHRGPLSLLVIWIMLALLSIVWVTTDVKINIWPWSIVIPVMHLFYAISLTCKGSAVLQSVISNNMNGSPAEDDERQALLGRSYIRFQDDFDELALGHGQDNKNILSKLSFYWVNSLIKKGLAGHLRRIDDLFMLPDALNVTRITENFHIALINSKNMIKTLHRCHGFEFYSIGILRLIADLSGFAGPILLGGLLSISNDNSHSNADNNNDDDDNIDAKPYYYALGLFATSLLSAFCGTHFNWRMSIITMKMRIGLVTAIYTKSLEVQSLDDTSPDILNLMSTDTDRIVNSCISFHSFWSIPFQLVVTLYLLYIQIGVAFVAGVIFAATLIPLNRWIAKKISLYSERLMWAKDARISVSSEALTNAKNIKLLAWEDIFKNKILGYRKNELVYLSKRKYLDALCVYFWATTPILMCLLTFSVSVLMGNSLTPASTFATVALLNMLIGPLNTFPWVLNGLIEAWVSVKRVQQLIDLPNIDYKKYHTMSDNITAIKITNSSFKFDQRHRNPGNNEGFISFHLNNISLTIEKGDLVCLEGPVGGGKSALLLAILAELSMIDNNGRISINHQNKGFGYVGQSTWLQRGTIRENILWGESLDENRYKKVIMACALAEDINKLGGDQIGVGEGGRTLSGGQQIRVALARAVYQDKPIYLLDDVLSALDAHVANHIVKHCILGMLKDKTCIIVTENRSLYYFANQILHISNGCVSVSEIGVDGFSDEEIFDVGNSSSSGAVANLNAIKNGEDEQTIAGIDNTEEQQQDNKSQDSVMMEETKEYGTLASNVFKCYWNATGRFLSITVLLSVILMQVTRNLSDVWLAHWVSQNNATTITTTITTHTTMISNSTIETTNFYLGTYAGIAILNSFITLGRAFVFAYAGIKAAKFIHHLLLNRVFGAKFQFFDVTPLGRILNRFSSDTYTIDDSLPFILNILLAQLAGLIGSIVISLYAMPWLSLIIVPLIPVYLNIQNRYRCSSRDIKRLSSNALSPLYAHFTETLQGLITIRAMCGKKRFHRDFLVKLEESIRAQLTASAAQQWLAIRLQLLGATLVGGAGLIAAITSAHQSSPGMVGLAISYALSVTGLLAGVLNAFAETEQELISVERVDQYCKLDKEYNVDGVIDSPPFGWPCQGVVSFKNTSMKYRGNLAPSLFDINFETSPCERIGIVGRTGAGKSSILSALMRVSPLNHGTIKIDCVDVNTIPLSVLRSRIAIVPQHPFLFSGTIRENLDPHGLHIDSKIWQSINQCLATPLVQSLGGLDGFIESNGSNLSAGQKQLLCLARALLKNAKIVCIDEGTANLDSDSEVSIQLVLRNSFKSSTVFVIAHRIQSFQHTDRILVMDSGRIIEQGLPSALSVDKTTYFYQMLKEQRINNFGFSDNGDDTTNEKEKLL